MPTIRPLKLSMKYEPPRERVRRKLITSIKNEQIASGLISNSLNSKNRSMIIDYVKLKKVFPSKV